MGDSDIGCFGCCVILVLTGALLGLPATSIYLGVTHLNQSNATNPSTSCPVQPQIPLFLVVLGAITYAYYLITILQTCCEKDDQRGCTCLSLLRWLVSFAFIGWTITGTVWYGEALGQRTGDFSSPNFCNYVLYAYFSSQVIMCCIFVLLLFLLTCCYCCCQPSGGPSSDPEARNIVNPHLSSGRYPVAPVTSIQTAERLRAIRSGPNLLWVYEQVQVRVVT